MKAQEFVEGQVLLVDKPLEWTSFNVVSKLKYKLKHKLNVRKIKVGHAGTLDPLATGLLIICTGKKTKTIPSLQDQEKEYTGTFIIGSTTPSFDLETAIDKEFPTEHIDDALLKEAVAKLTGPLEQLPPIFSAKKVNGQRAYDAARKGIALDLKKSSVEVKEFEFDASEFPLFKFRIVCSKGTYIRAIARDLGEYLGSGAHMTSLCRTRIGDFKLSDARSVEEMVEIIETSET